MTSRNLQYLSEAQNRTAKALQGLLVQLRRSSGIQTTGDARRTLAALQRSRRQTESPAPTLLRTADLERVLRPLIGRTRRDPAAVARADTFPQKKQLLGTSAEVQLQAGRAIGGGEDFSRTITAVTRTAKNFGRILDQNTKALQQNREAIGAGQSLLTGVFSSQGRGGGSSALLGSGLGLVPLGLRIAGLFRKRRAEPQSFSPFELPPSLSLEVANTDDILHGFSRVARTQAGEIRVIRQESPAAQPQVTVNVNAMDTQSFLDRSEDIAGALRDAMLHMHPISTVRGKLRQRTVSLYRSMYYGLFSPGTI